MTFARRSRWLSSSIVMIAIGYSGCASSARIEAANPAPDLLTNFSPSGIAVHDRAQGTPLLELTLSGVGREAAVAPTAAGRLSSHGSRIEIRRPGLVEWYVESVAGLEHGFTLVSRPRGAGALVLELSCHGATASLREAQLEFATPTGRRLSYGRLTATDAQGRVLETHFKILSEQAVQLRVDDSGADYPIVLARS